MEKNKRDFSNRDRKYWVPEFKGAKLSLAEFCEKVAKLGNPCKIHQEEVITVFEKFCSLSAEIIRKELESKKVFVLVGVGKFYLLKGKSGQSFIKFSSKYNR
jgi:hypothetical protein